MWTRGDGHRLGAQVHAVRVGAVHPPVDIEQRRARAVNRDLDLFWRLGGMQRGAAVAIQRAGRLVVERHAEAVLAVGWKRVRHREPAAGAMGRALDVLALRGPARDRVGRLARRRRAVAHREAADLGGSRQI